MISEDFDTTKDDILTRFCIVMKNRGYDIYKYRYLLYHYDGCAITVMDLNKVKEAKNILVSSSISSAFMKNRNIPGYVVFPITVQEFKIAEKIRKEYGEKQGVEVFNDIFTHPVYPNTFPEEL
jgi:hypothetical protein